MVQPVKLATPEDTVAEGPPVQLREALLVPVPPVMARATGSVLSDVTGLPLPSSTVTLAEKLRVLLAWVELGWEVKASWVAGPAVIAKEFEVPEVSVLPLAMSW